jgi:hypothetical protein
MNRGTALALIGVGAAVGYITIKGVWPQVLLALLYPQYITVQGG